MTGQDAGLAVAPRASRYLLPLSERWILIALAPAPRVIVLGLFLDGALVDLVDEPLDVRGYLHASAAFRRSSRSSFPPERPSDVPRPSADLAFVQAIFADDADPCRIDKHYRLAEQLRRQPGVGNLFRGR